jgi:hypothetical protein
MIGRTSSTQKASPLSTATQRAPVVPRRVLAVALLVAGTALYWALYRLVPFFHEGRILQTTLFFAGAAGYFLGFRAGFAASIAGLALHTVILNELGYPGWGAIAGRPWAGCAARSAACAARSSCAGTWRRACARARCTTARSSSA